MQTNFTILLWHFIIILFLAQYTEKFLGPHWRNLVRRNKPPLMEPGRRNRGTCLTGHLCLVSSSNIIATSGNPSQNAMVNQNHWFPLFQVNNQNKWIWINDSQQKGIQVWDLTQRSESALIDSIQSCPDNGYKIIWPKYSFEFHLHMTSNYLWQSKVL